MKANKQGISLIVLVITIVVVIILAAAVILALNGNNPIDNARIANFAQTKDGIASAILSYEGTIEAKTQGYFTTDQIILGTAAKDTAATSSAILSEGSGKYAIIEGTVSTDGDLTKAVVNGTDSGLYNVKATKVNPSDSDAVNLYYIDKTRFEKLVGESLPATPAANAKWAIDEDGTVYLVFSSIDNIPSWMGYKKGESTAAAKLAGLADDSTLVSSVYYLGDK